MKSRVLGANQTHSQLILRLYHMVEKFKAHLSGLEDLEPQDIAAKGSEKYLCSGYRLSLIHI